MKTEDTKYVLPRLYYDEGSKTCVKWVDGVRKDKSVGSFDASTGYYKVRINNGTFYLHRLVYQLVSGELLSREQQIDHKNGDRLDNRFENLRVVPHCTNGRNVKLPVTNSSGVVGVSKNIQNTPSGVYEYWQAGCTLLDGTVHTKAFSISKLGDEVAFKMAVDYRCMMISTLNAQSAGYTVAHGVRT